MQVETSLFGRTLRFWRQTLKVSQEDLSLDLDISRKHLSFLETGRASPSRELVFNIAEALKLHERDVNNLLVAAGFAPTALAQPSDDPGELWRKKALTIMLKGQDPNPCCVRDRYGYVKAVNRAWVAYNQDWIGDLIFEVPLNVYALHFIEGGWRSCIQNWDEVGWQGVLALKQELLFAPNEDAEQLYQSIVSRPDVKPALESRMQLTPSANVATSGLQKEGGPIYTVTSITTTFTEDQVSEPRLIIDTVYPRNFSFPYTKESLQADSNLHHPLLYY